MENSQLLHILVEEVNKSYFNFTNSKTYNTKISQGFKHDDIIKTWLISIKLIINDFINKNNVNIDLSFTDEKHLFDKLIYYDNSKNMNVY